MNKYVLATDKDFEGKEDGKFVYIGKADYVIIPEYIKGVKVTRACYDNKHVMFEKRTSIKGVAFENAKNIVDMSYLFFKNSSSRLDLSRLDTSNVRSMEWMFAMSSAGTLDLGGFDTSKVTNMYGMFYYSKVESLDLRSFDTSNVEDMVWMFGWTNATDLNLSSFNTSKVKNMFAMFSDSPALTLDLGSFDTSNVENMSNMFASTKAERLDLSHFNTSNVNDMWAMFSYANVKELDLSNFDTSKVTKMSQMFAGCKATKIDIRNFDTSNVEDMAFMFSRSNVRTLNLSHFNTSKVTNMKQMFEGSKVRDLNLSGFNTSKVVDMSDMFSSLPVKNLDLSSFNTSNVKDMKQMFFKAKATTLDLSNFNTSNVKYMEKMFDGAEAEILNVSSFDTKNITNMSRMFASTRATDLDLSSFDTSKVTNMQGMFSRSMVKALDLTSFDISKVKNIDRMFFDCNVEEIDLSTFEFNELKIDNVLFGNAPIKIGYAKNEIEKDKLNKYKNVFIIKGEEEVSLKKDKESHLDELLEKKITYSNIEEFVKEVAPHDLGDFTKIKKGIRFKGKKETTSANVVKTITSLYAKQWRNNRYNDSSFSGARVDDAYLGVITDNVYNLKKDPLADKIAERLNQKDLEDVLYGAIYGRVYRRYLLAFARYASDKAIKAAVSDARKFKSGNKQERAWAHDVACALCLSDSVRAIEYVDEAGLLDHYAELRGVTTVNYYDTILLDEFTSGKTKQFFVGSTILEASLDKDLKIVVYNYENDKTTKSFPKVDGPKREFEKAENNFKEFRKSVNSLIKKRIDQFSRVHLNHEYIKQDLWMDVYLNHFVLHVMVELLLWQDKEGNVFIVTDGKITDINENPYKPVGDITLAHNYSMTKEQIKKWQDFYAETKRKQLFAQIWEPEYNLKEDIENRYKDAVITIKERNSLRSRVISKGLRFKTDYRESYFSVEQWQYVTSEEGHLLIDDVKVEFLYDEDKKIMTLEKLIKPNKITDRKLSSIIFELDKTVINTIIINDEVDKIKVEFIENWTLSQFNEYIKLSTKHKAVKCAALFLDHKNKKYPDVSWLDLLTLE